MKRWIVRVAQVALGAFIGSMVLENLTRLAIWQFVPRVHDVQFAILIMVISTVGGILGGVVAIALLLSKIQRYKLAGLLASLFGGLSIALSLPQVIQARKAFDGNNQPLIDAMAYVGFTSVFSVALLFWGVVLLFKRVSKSV